MGLLSTLSRSQSIASLTHQTFDIAVIGGGITGAGIALDAASRGLSVVLIEKYDFASGTSSKSTKLIHGGLRYLKQMEFSLVREVGRERAVIYHLAPHLVTPVNMLLPVYKNGSLGKISTAMALWIYDHLARVQKQDAFKMMTLDEMTAMEPLLNREGLEGGAVYKEYRTDDARLTLSVLKTAANYGAVCLNYARCESFRLNDEKQINGLQIRDLINNISVSVNARVVINAAGPWVDEVRSMETVPKGKKLHLTKGIHFVVPHSALPVQHALYFDVEGDERMIFVIPRDSMVYIGTTDTNYTGDKDLIAVTQDDVQYLLKAVNVMFPSVRIDVKDIISSWAGLRPLIHEEGKSPSELSRKDEIFISEGGLISIAGGKLTGYRKMAQKAVNLVAKKLEKIKGTDIPGSDTEQILLVGGDLHMLMDEYIARRTGEAKQIGAVHALVSRWVRTYGTGAEAIIEKAFELYHLVPDTEERLLTAEIAYTIESEMATHISDFFIRRTGALYFDPEWARAQYPLAQRIFSQLLQLSPEAEAEQLAFFEQMLRTSVSFSTI